MVDQDIASRVSDFILKELAAAPPEGGLAPDFPIIEKGLVDSLGLFKLVAFMEDEFRVSIAPEEILFENFANVRSIASLIQDKVGAGASG